jgi:hypothetical protein
MTDDETTNSDDTTSAGDDTPSAGDAAADVHADAADATPPPETADADATPPPDADATPPPETADADATMPGTTPAPAAPAAAAASDERAGVFVPRWVAFLVVGLLAVLLVGGGGFALGRATDGGDDEGGAVVVRPGGGQLPDIPGFPLPDERSPRDLPGPPDVPGVPSDGVLLGVAVESATDGGQGVRVVRVVPGSPAEDAGIETGDIITKVDDTDIGNASELVKTIGSHDPGDTVTITYERDGESTTADVTLAGGSES